MTRFTRRPWRGGGGSGSRQGLSAPSRPALERSVMTVLLLPPLLAPWCQRVRGGLRKARRRAQDGSDWVGFRGWVRAREL